MALLLNCDLGENAHKNTANTDAIVMPHIDLANIACAMHAGSPALMLRTLQLAKKNNVTIGAHPGYADVQNFGRVSIPHNKEELNRLIFFQVSALAGMAQNLGLSVDYVKPHGALYNDMMANETIRHHIMATIANHHSVNSLMLLETSLADKHREEAEKAGIKLIFEAYGDRQYDDNGHLLPRTYEGAIHSRQQMIEQVMQLSEDQSVTSISGKKIVIKADTLCVHGDNEEAVLAIQTINALLSRKPQSHDR